jgi:hypothetical protein
MASGSGEQDAADAGQPVDRVVGVPRRAGVAGAAGDGVLICRARSWLVSSGRLTTLAAEEGWLTLDSEQ